MFPDFPDAARLWVFGFSQPLSAGDKDVVSNALNQFLKTWASHQVPVRGAFQVVQNRFVLLTGETQGGPSGCSIDSSVQVFKNLQLSHGLDALDRSLVFYKNNETVVSKNRLDFKNEVISGNIGPATPVFDLTVQTVGGLRANGFELPFEKSWHRDAFPAPV